MIADKLAELEAAKAAVAAAQALVKSVEIELAVILEAEGWNYHNSIQDYGYGECVGWSGWLHPSVPLDGDPPEDESLMCLYKWPSCSFEIYS